MQMQEKNNGNSFEFRRFVEYFQKNEKIVFAFWRKIHKKKPVSTNNLFLMHTAVCE